MKKLRNISRIDSHSTAGWQVRIVREGREHSRFFADSRNGGKLKARRAAIEFRDKALQKLESQSTGRRVVRSSRANSTGVIGVSRTRTKVGNRWVENYSVSWRSAPGHACARKFSIRKYGEKGAFLRAVALRKQVEREIYGKVIRRPRKEPNAES